MQRYRALFVIDTATAGGVLEAEIQFFEDSEGEWVKHAEAKDYEEQNAAAGGRIAELERQLAEKDVKIANLTSWVANYAGALSTGKSRSRKATPRTPS